MKKPSSDITMSSIILFGISGALSWDVAQSEPMSEVSSGWSSLSPVPCVLVLAIFLMKVAGVAIDLLSAEIAVMRSAGVSSETSKMRDAIRSALWSQGDALTHSRYSAERGFAAGCLLLMFGLDPEKSKGASRKLQWSNLSADTIRDALSQVGHDATMALPALAVMATLTWLIWDISSGLQDIVKSPPEIPLNAHPCQRPDAA